MAVFKLMFLILLLNHCKFTITSEIVLTHAKAIKENDSEFADFTQMKVKRFNRTNLWTGNMTFHVDIGNDYELEGFLYKKIANKYQLTPYRTRRQRYCHYIEKLPTTNDLRKVSDIPAAGVCPWKAKTYHIWGYILDVDKLPDVFDGDYMIELKYYKDNVYLNGFQVYGSVMKL